MHNIFINFLFEKQVDESTEKSYEAKVWKPYFRFLLFHHHASKIVKRKAKISNSNVHKIEKKKEKLTKSCILQLKFEPSDDKLIFAVEQQKTGFSRSQIKCAFLCQNILYFPTSMQYIHLFPLPSLI